MPRMTIWIPDRLAAEVERYKGRINLSAICQKALEGELKVISKAASGDIKAQVVHRLLNTPDALAGSYERGLRAGREWAEESALWPDLVLWAAIKKVATHEQKPVKVGPPGHQVEETVALVLDGNPSGMIPVGLLNPYKALPGQYWHDPAHWERYFSGVRDGAKEIHDLVKADMGKKA